MDATTPDQPIVTPVRHAWRPDRRGLLAASIGGGLLAVVPGGRDAGAVSQRQAQDCDLGNTDPALATVPPDCPVFPADNIWNTPVADLPLDPQSDAYLANMSAESGLHADFGSGLYEGLPLGIPFLRVPADQPMVDVTFEVAEESDEGPYPIPPDAPIEGGSCGTGDRHVIIVQEETCLLYELFDAEQQPDGSWTAFGGARFDLTSHELRPDTWTSADAAGLPILPGLVRYEEIEAGEIAHALRFTVATTRQDYVWPARHQAGATDDPDVPPMGQRFRLKADVDITGFSATNRIILQALQTYGMFLADNGSDWFFSGVPDDRWDNDDLHELQELIHGADFEAVDCTSLMADPNSGQIA